MFKRLFTAAILLGVASTAPPVHAQQLACAQRDRLAERLSTTYKELPVAGGLQNSQRLVEVWASPDTGTFTIIFTNADGMSCIVATGTNYHQGKLAAVTAETES